MILIGLIDFGQDPSGLSENLSKLPSIFQPKITPCVKINQYNIINYYSFMINRKKKEFTVLKQFNRLSSHVLLLYLIL